MELPNDVVYGGIDDPTETDREKMYKRTIAEQQKEVHALQMRVKALSEQNYSLKQQLNMIVGNQDP